jgi:hypothetical protein
MGGRLVTDLRAGRLIGRQCAGSKHQASGVIRCMTTLDRSVTLYGVETLRIHPAALGRPLDDVVSVYLEARWLAGDDWRRCPSDAVDAIRGVLMAVDWLDGTTDVGFDPSIPCPPRSRADVERQAVAVYRVVRWIGRRDMSTNVTLFALRDMLNFVLGRSDRSPVEKALPRHQAA